MSAFPVETANSASVVLPLRRWRTAAEGLEGVDVLCADNAEEDPRELIRRVRELIHEFVTDEIVRARLIALLEE